MPLETKQIQKLATLSRLAFAEDKLPAFAREFDSILSFVDKIQQLDTAGVPPLTFAGEVTVRMEIVTADNMDPYRRLDNVEIEEPRTVISRGHDFLEAWLRVAPYK